MRIAVLGAVDFSRHCLERLIAEDANIVAVFTADEDRAQKHDDFSNLCKLAEAEEVPCYRANDVNSDSTIQTLSDHDPDYLFVLGWSQILDERALEVPVKGCIGTHPTPLPKGRGRHPIIWALAKGLDRTGLTFLWLESDLDAGPMLWQDTLRIETTDHAFDLYRKIQDLATQALPEILDDLASGDPPRIPQDDDEATYWPQRGFDDGEIDWTDTAEDAYNLVRALAEPYPGAHTWLEDEIVKVWAAEPPKTPTEPERDPEEPGMILDRTDENLVIQTGRGRLSVVDWEAPDGVPLEPGECFSMKAKGD